MMRLDNLVKKKNNLKIHLLMPVKSYLSMSGFEQVGFCDVILQKKVI